jgi:hypothetical protein
MISKSFTMMLASSKIMYFITRSIKHQKMIYFKNYFKLNNTSPLYLGASIFFLIYKILID